MRPLSKGKESSGGIFKQAAVQVLEVEKTFLNAKEITRLALKHGYIKPTGDKPLTGKTPDNTMTSALYTDKKSGQRALFIRGGPGRFGLQKWKSDPVLAKVVEKELKEFKENSSPEVQRKTKSVKETFQTVPLKEREQPMTPSKSPVHHGISTRFSCRTKEADDFEGGKGKMPMDTSEEQPQSNNYNSWASVKEDSSSTLHTPLLHLLETAERIIQTDECELSSSPASPATTEELPSATMACDEDEACTPSSYKPAEEAPSNSVVTASSESQGEKKRSVSNDISGKLTSQDLSPVSSFLHSSGDFQEELAHILHTDSALEDLLVSQLETYDTSDPVRLAKLWLAYGEICGYKGNREKAASAQAKAWQVFGAVNSSMIDFCALKFHVTDHLSLQDGGEEVW
ncbi:hypothetical protein CYMTET_5566 [Cymbomonas tetramitiformis]|uniref:HTH HARE-type domain-containing protein n=1 Tax=Cymbomonas tetramitiformis TaxID=36881 RepID=A0AAE0GZ53_9CHLO|nr:hypothetical protein CYMTET_5566 [Cymbomonas tetramitiformis]